MAFFCSMGDSVSESVRNARSRASLLNMSSSLASAVASSAAAAASSAARVLPGGGSVAIPSV